MRLGLAAVALLALAACATQPPRPALPAVAGDPAQHQQQREVALTAAPSWSLAGRVALSNGRDGGSGRLDWHQAGPRYEVALSAPVTRQSWRLSGSPGEALLEGLEGGPRQGSDATALLREATRWEIPVEALASWVRGVRADEARFGAARLQFGDDGRLSQLEQGGWRIDYTGWQSVAGMPVELPHRLNAVRGEARVRLIVDQWQ
ncbi:MAG TPA: lipoprotein insertase outer membrane protein LolB [Xanthomonadaceae bacterium]|nr:lipoprotein insertase outer membrane protein LolB [Xanthomonadaceae bacterium]